MFIYKTTFLLIYAIFVLGISSTLNKDTSALTLRTIKGAEEVVDTTNIYYINVQGGGDLTKHIQDQIDAVPNGTAQKANVIKFPRGRFWTEGNLEWNPKGKNGIINFVNKHHLIIEGFSKEEPTVFYTKAPAIPFGGNVSRGNYSHRRHFRIHQSTNITVRNIRIEGSNTIEGKVLGSSSEFTPDFWEGGKDSGSKSGFPAYQSYWEFEHAFDIINSQNITIEDSSVYGVWGDGVYIGQSTTNPSENIILRNLHLKFTGLQGIAVSDARKIIIDKVWIDKGRRSGIDLEPFHDEGFANDVEVRNSKIDVQLTPFAAGGRGDVSNIYIHNNEYTGSGNTIFCRTSNEKNPTIRKNWKFIKNVRTNTYGSSSPVIKFGWTENILIEGNVDRVSHKKGLYVGASYCNNIVIKDNEVKGGKAIRIYKSNNLEVKKNKPGLEVINNG
ncbi:right-handed parallel beta-helix repeat-containing protein [Antarcticibacterium sp. 1MA-6-2]|uniref:right-handed parallel beta-helix repeat-containing protein n=1 Tax=Antarcticibacterium sp. 1MA-6-2 TaxID=2908210 RepID=UPI001F45A3D2|nr:right-handed parallel beta-helix repeat-containing protein [Antarcticibacterium sp. 1MA-6-2]UJH91038.1 right-handed parallel beta-helix repeat-containing protein [Antarcticibacterium sp. 1MA-6-2]